MEKDTVTKIVHIQQLVMADPDCQLLLDEYHYAGAALGDLLKHLPEADRATVEHFLGIAIQLHICLLELACQ